MVEAFAMPASVLPHRGHALWLESVLELEPHRLLALGRVPASSPFAQGGICPAFTGLELCAQAVGYHAALPDRQGAGSRHGYLVGVQSLELLAPALPVDAPLRVEVERQGSAGALAIYVVRMMDEARLLLRGTVSLYLEP